MANCTKRFFIFLAQYSHLPPSLFLLCYTLYHVIKNRIWAILTKMNSSAMWWKKIWKHVFHVHVHIHSIYKDVIWHICVIVPKVRSITSQLHRGIIEILLYQLNASLCSVAIAIFRLVFGGGAGGIKSDQETFATVCMKAYSMWNTAHGHFYHFWLLKYFLSRRQHSFTL